MQEHRSITTSVVVGIDGSRPALDAALWAVDEAVSRDIPLTARVCNRPRRFRQHRSATFWHGNSRPPRVAVSTHSRRSSQRTSRSRSRSRSCKTGRRARCWRPHGGQPWCASARRVSNTAPTAGLARPRRRWRHPPIARWPSSVDTTRSMRNNSWVVAEVDESAVSDGVLRASARRGTASRRPAAGVDHVAITVHRHLRRRCRRRRQPAGRGRSLTAASRSGRSVTPIWTCVRWPSTGTP